MRELLKESRRKQSVRTWERASFGACELESVRAWERASVGAWELESVRAWKRGSLGACKLGSVRARVLRQINPPIGIRLQGHAIKLIAIEMPIDYASDNCAFNKPDTVRV